MGGASIGSMSWEDCVNVSVINGNVDKLDGVADTWSAVFRNADSVHDELHTLVSDLDDWKGPAGEAYRKNLTKIADAVQQVADDNKTKVTGLLSDCSQALGALQDEMPIPSEMYDQVQGYRQQANDRNAQVAGAFLLHGPLGAVAADYLMPESLKNTLFNNRVSDWIGDHVSHLTDWVDDKVKGRTDQARHLLDTADTNYAAAVNHAGDPTLVDPSIGADDSRYAGDAAGPSATASEAPSSGAPSGVPDTNGPDVDHAGYHDPNSTLDGGTDPGTDGDGSDDLPGYGDGAPFGSGGDDSSPGGSGLAGAGGAPSGAGASPAGLGSGGAGPVGLAGKPVNMGNPDGAGLAGAGRPGMMGGRGARGGGGGGGGSEVHETWLTEDEDPWGGDEDAAPPVLGR